MKYSDKSCEKERVYFASKVKDTQFIVVELKTSGLAYYNEEVESDYAQLEKDPIRENGAAHFTECCSMEINPIRIQSCPENNKT